MKLLNQILLNMLGAIHKQRGHIFFNFMTPLPPFHCLFTIVNFFKAKVF